MLPLRPAPKGRRVDPGALAEVRRVLGGEPRPDLLLEYLHGLQDGFGHLRDIHLVALASAMGLAYAEVYEVATFYHNFDVVKDGAAPPPALTMRVCGSLPCELAGSGRLLAALEEQYGERVRVRATSCLGRCAGAPAVLVGQRPVERASDDSVAAAVRDGRMTPDMPAYVSYAAYRQQGGYALLASCSAGDRSRGDILAEVEAAGLRGLGGAGFPAAQKWRVVHGEPAPRYMVVNADESEPGSFKDRHCLETDPHRVLEGALLAAWAVEADDVYIYVRDEYAGARTLLGREIAALAAEPPCPLPSLHLRRGAGSYICGEETALLESIEGRRPEPRLRPPYPAQVGLFGRPTLVHNVETLFWLREILEGGGVRFAALGRNGAKGRRLLSVSGRVARPGVYAVPAGTTARELIDDHAGGMVAGHALYAYMPAGASGGILPASLADVPLDFGRLEPHGSLVGPGSLIVLSDQDRSSTAAVSQMRFFAHESCGECTPCRNGTARAVRLLEAGEWGSPRIRDLCQTLCDASICGLGQAAPLGVRSVIRHFPQEADA